MQDPTPFHPQQQEVLKGACEIAHGPSGLSAAGNAVLFPVTGPTQEPLTDVAHSKSPVATAVPSWISRNIWLPWQK